MKYETPELTALTPAINAIQTPSTKIGNPYPDTSQPEVLPDESTAGYQDWE